MIALRVVAVASFLAGIALLAWIFGAMRSPEPEAVTPLAAFDLPTIGGVVSSTPTVVLPEKPTPTATPEPFVGEVVGFRIPRFEVDAGIENIG